MLQQERLSQRGNRGNTKCQNGIKCNSSIHGHCSNSMVQGHCFNTITLGHFWKNVIKQKTDKIFA